MDYGSSEEEGFLDRMKAAIEGGSLGKHLLYAAIIIAVLAAGYYFLFLAPKPATVVVVVRELDGGEIDGAQVYFSDPSGNPVGVTQFTQGGSAVFDGIPTQVPLYVTADAGSGYVIGRQPVQLESGGPASVEVSVEKRNGIEITATDVPQSFAGGCKDRFFIEVTNFGEDPFNAQLIGEGSGDFARYFSVQGASRVLSPNESANFSVFAELPDPQNSGEQVSLDGAFRIKGTTRTVAVSGAVGSAVRVEVSDSEIYYTRDSNNARLITVRNTGSQPLENFGARMVLEGKLQQECGADGGRCFKVEVLGEGRSRNAISAGGKADLVLRITAPSASDTFFGSLEVFGTCLNSPGISIPVVLDLKNQ